MRIAIFTPGGIARWNRGIHSPHLFEFVEMMSGCHDISVYSLRNSPLDPAVDTCGNAVVRNVRASRNDPLPEKFQAFHRSFADDHRRKPFDLLHGFWALPCGLIAVTIAGLHRLPGIVTLLGGETADVRSIRYGNMRRFPSRLLTRWVCRRATKLVVLTNFQRAEVASRLFRNDCEVIPFGADTSRFFPRRELKAVPPYRILHVANLTEVKDQARLLRAFARLRGSVQCTLQIIGPDFLDGALQTLAHQMGLNEFVKFSGYIHHDELPREYRASHLLLHTSLHEAQGVVIAEACASGVVPVGTRTGLLADLEDIVGDHLCAESPDGLSEKASVLLNDRRLYRSIRKQVRSWAVSHDLTRTMQQYTDLYESFA